MLEAVSLYYIEIFELNYITCSHGDLEWLIYYTFCIILQCAMLCGLCDSQLIVSIPHKSSYHFFEL